MDDMQVRYTVNEDATVISITVTSNDGKPLSVKDLTQAFEVVLDEITCTPVPDSEMH